MENKTYEFEISGKTITVTAQEVLALYGPHYGLKQEDIEGYAGRYTAQIQYYGECDRWLDKALVSRLIEEEHLMKEGEADGFKLQLTFTWYVELKKEDRRYLPFQYIVSAWCLDNAQTFERRYRTLPVALLLCLNGFNENVAVRNRYDSIEQYLNNPSCK